MLHVLHPAVPNTQKPYPLFTDTSYNASSVVLTQAVDGPDYLRPIADGLQLKKGTFAVYQSILKFNLYLRGVECILC